MGDNIKKAFFSKYEENFEKSNPKPKDVIVMFKWLENESKNAKFLRTLKI